MQFLREMVKARTSPVLDLAEHHEVQWLFPHLVPFQVDNAAVAGDVVLRSPRVTLEDPPELPEQLTDWVDMSTEIGNSSGAGPVFRELENFSPSVVRQKHRQFEQWQRKWSTWAQLDRQRRPSYDLYVTLNAMLRDLNAQPESVELVVASGLLTLPPKDTGGRRIRTHIVTQEAGIERDEHSGDLLVRLVDLTSPRLEDTQLLTEFEVFDASGSLSLQTQLKECSSPVDIAIPVFLKGWAERALNIQVTVNEEFDAPDAIADRSLSVAPALILRRRGAFALVEYYDKMINLAETGDEKTPLGLAQLVTAIEADERVEWLQSTDATAPRELADDPLFPLPANAEQATIIDQLGSDSGVVVEGPPGTGKTHTIANLVSALLARGQRVLVTSEKSQALQVLRDKLPAEMQELCVSITDLARGGSRELDHSVVTIASRRAAFDPVQASNLIDDLAKKRVVARGKRSGILESIRALRESETYQHPEVVPGYRGTLAQIVQQLNLHRDEFSWLPGPVSTTEPTVTADELLRLASLLQNQTLEHHARAGQHLPSLDRILPPHAHLTRLFAAINTPSAPSSPRSAEIVDLLQNATTDNSTSILQACSELQSRTADMRRLPQDIQALADRVLAGSMSHLWSRVADIDAYVDAAISADRKVGVTRVESEPVSRRTLATIEAWLQALQSGTEWRRGKFRRSQEQKAYEALELTSLVDGEPVGRAPELALLVEHLGALEAIESARQILADIGVELPAHQSRTVQVNELQGIRSRLAEVDRLITARNILQQRISDCTGRLVHIASVDDAADIATAAEAITRELQRKAARVEVEDLVERLGHEYGNTPAPEARALITCISAAALSDLDDAIFAYQRAREQQVQLEECERLATGLRDGAPALLTKLRATPGHDEWPARAAHLIAAWHWRYAEDWVLTQQTPGREKALSDELDAVTTDIGTLTARLASERAWKSSLERMTAGEMQALQTYRDHIRNVGKGTGKHAEKYRLAARSAMQDAQSAVPAWVMPTQQVLASIPPQQNTFDVVIVDEASQVDITHLYLLWLAPRVIVVGDEKQCTPSEVAQGSLEDIFARLDNHLADLPTHVRASFTPRSSLFSLLRSRFGHMVRLREHFRSMPEIINWSSNEFYRDAPLVPVRQFGADRLDPLRTTYVPNATVTGKNATLANAVEAEAIADQIVACVEDPAYDGKTMGVVVLQGHSQVTAILNALQGRLSEEEWEERRFRIGTPPDFQGDERDVVFLSLVVAPEQNFQSLTRTEFEQRFNVGATRAKDQMWLFHSVTADRLKTGDLRKSLLEYMTSTRSAAADPIPTNVSDHVRDSRFDSLFEQRVFNQIVARGYHVNPQVQVNHRRIDLVVTGSASRLAVECDGDAFHTTPEQMRDDLKRETELRRCGWRFWRVRESEFYLDPVAALSSLWAELDQLGIRPVGSKPLVSNGTSDIPTPHHVPAQPNSPAPAARTTPSPTPAAATQDQVHPAPRPDVEAQLTDEHELVEPVDMEVTTRSDNVGLDSVETDDRSDAAASPEDVKVAVLESSTDTVIMSDDEIRTVLTYNAERGSVDPETLAVDLGVPAERVRNIMDTLVASGKQARRTGPQPQQNHTSPQFKDMEEGGRDSETIRRVLVAGAWSTVPLTVERAKKISRIDDSNEVRAHLDHLVEAGKLVETATQSGRQWTRPQSAKARR